MGDRKKLRGCFRVSLRTSFIVLTIACIWLGTVVQKAFHQKRSVEWIMQVHGRVCYDYHFTGQFGPRYVDLNATPPGPDWLRERIGIDYLAEVKSVQLRAMSASAPGVFDISPISALVDLEELRCERTAIADLRPLKRLRSLERLYLGYTNVTDVTPLTKLRNLTHLSLNNSKVTNVTGLSQLKKLETLSLHNTPVKEEDYLHFKRTLPDCRITWSTYD